MIRMIPKNDTRKLKNVRPEKTTEHKTYQDRVALASRKGLEQIAIALWTGTVTVQSCTTSWKVAIQAKFWRKKLKVIKNVKKFCEFESHPSHTKDLENVDIISWATSLRAISIKQRDGFLVGECCVSDSCVQTGI